MARAHLETIHSRDSAEDILFRANSLLSSRRPSEALPLYTRILYDISPGHVFAFLNRSLAYVVLGYPELAVVDAYRAAIASHEMRDPDSGLAKSRIRVIQMAMTSERLHVRNEALWTLPQHCYVAGGWLSTPMASIVISQDPKQAATPAQPHLPDWLEARALYRMCGALWSCGGGAYADSLGIISDVMARAQKSPTLSCFKGYFNDLGNCILEDVQADLDKESSETPSPQLPKLAKLKNSETMALRIDRSLSRGGETFVNRVIYPWNKFESQVLNRGEVPSNEQEEQRNFAVSSQSDQIRTLQLAAKKDIYPGTEIWSGRSILRVMTASSNDIELCCDTCATIILGTNPSGYVRNCTCSERSDSSTSLGSGSFDLDKSRVDMKGSCCSGTEQNCSPTPASKPSSCTASMTRKSSSTLPASTSPSRKAATFRAFAQTYEIESQIEDRLSCIGGCNHCGNSFFCSDICRVTATRYHAEICGLGVEDLIRQSFPLRRAIPSGDLEIRSLRNHPKVQCLYSLILTRIFAIAVKERLNPLALDEISCLNGDLHELSPSVDHSIRDGYYRGSLIDERLRQSKTLPWSFTTNVVRPIQWLLEARCDPIIGVDCCDGWIVNTLLAKIQYSARISKGPRQVKVPKQNLLFSCRPKAVAEYTSDLDEDVWIANLHTKAAMVNAADAARGQRANVEVKDDGDIVQCTALEGHGNGHKEGEHDVDVVMEGQPEFGTEDKSRTRSTPNDYKPSIRTGDLLLRSYDPVIDGIFRPRTQAHSELANSETM
ncbi:hypothetical protein MMC20_003005 [Loxospora ochrophaea]|nr:hypothetical protein [Loxospora ochrophaea]